MSHYTPPCDHRKNIITSLFCPLFFLKKGQEKQMTCKRRLAGASYISFLSRNRYCQSLPAFRAISLSETKNKGEAGAVTMKNATNRVSVHKCTHPYCTYYFSALFIFFVFNQINNGLIFKNEAAHIIYNNNYFQDAPKSLILYIQNNFKGKLCFIIQMVLSFLLPKSFLPFFSVSPCSNFYNWLSLLHIWLPLLFILILSSFLDVGFLALNNQPPFKLLTGVLNLSALQNLQTGASFYRRWQHNLNFFSFKWVTFYSL